MARATRKKEVWSFFSGAMGLDLGLVDAGLPATFANEVDKACCETIRKNKPDITLVQDSIATLTGAKIRKIRNFKGDVELMVGGPPCQSFSSGGKRAALTDPRGNLIYEYLRLIGEVRPKYFVLENVANLTTAALTHRPISQRPGQHWSLKTYDKKWQSGDAHNAALSDDELSGSAVKQVLKDVRELGYHVTFGVLDSADYGAPQHRLRFVMIGARDAPPPMLPAPTHGPDTANCYVTVRDAIWQLRRYPGVGSQYTPDVQKYFSQVPEGKNWRALPKDIQREALGGSFEAGGGKTGFYRRLAWGRPSPTITGRANRKGSALCHPEKDRPLSVKECAALQGFPATWKFSGAMNTQYMQIGNAVPVALGAAIGKAILAHKEQAQVEISDNYEQLLTLAVARLRAAARNHRPTKIAA